MTISAEIPQGPHIPELSGNLPLLEQALQLSRAGLKLVLVHAPVVREGVTTCTCEIPSCVQQKSVGKHPIARAWQAGLIGEEQVRNALARRRFIPNIGIVLGEQPSGAYLVSIDIDEEGRFKELETELGELPPTATCVSARGEKRFYSIPIDVDRERIKNVTGVGGKSGVDLKVKGGQVVVPPSVHASGVPYRWTQTGAIAELPASWILAVLKKPDVPSFVQGYTPATMREDKRLRGRTEKYLEKACLSEASILSKTKKGQRNSSFYRSLCALLPLAHGCSLPRGHDYVVRELSRAAQATGLGEKEIQATVASAEKWVKESGAVRVMPYLVSSPKSERSPSKPSEPVPTRPGTSETGSIEESWDFGDEPGTSADARAAFLEALGELRENLQHEPSIKLLVHKGQNAPCAENVARTLEQDPHWHGGPKFDRFRQTLTWPRVPECLKSTHRNSWNDVVDSDALGLQGWLLSQPTDVRVAVGSDIAWAGILLAAHRNHFDSLVSKVEAFPEWDLFPRLDTWLTHVYGAEPTETNRRIGRAWLIGSMARVFQPGCMVDVVPILETQRQRVGKNRSLDALYFGAPYIQLPSIVKVGENAELDRTAGSCWCIHDDESKLFSSTRDSMMAWITRQVDTYRVAWGRTQLVVPRRAVLVCSTNRTDYLVGTENRRFAPVRCSDAGIDVEWVFREREQLWAEVLVAYRTKEPWYFVQTDAAWEGLEEAQEARREEDGMASAVRMYLAQAVRPSEPQASDILSACGVEPAKQDPQMVRRLGRIMASLGYKHIVARVAGSKMGRVYRQKT